MSRLNQLVAELFADEVDTIGDETPFAECPGWDSLKHVELVVSIQTRFSVDLSADEIARLTNTRAARELLAARGIHE